MNQRLQRYSGVFLIVLSLLTLGMMVYFSNENRQITRCQARYNQQFAEHLRIRAEITENDRESLADAMKAILDSGTREDTDKAIREYLETKERNDEQRKEHPLSELPTTAQC